MLAIYVTCLAVQKSCSEFFFSAFGRQQKLHARISVSVYQTVRECMCKTSCVPCCGEEKPFDLLRGRGTFSPRIEQLAIHKQNTNRRRCELSFCKLFVLWPCEHTHTHTHAFTQTHTRRGRHADILYQCVHTPLGPNDAYKMQQQQFSAFFLNGNFFVVAVQQPSPPTICPPLPRIFQPH